MKELTKKPSRFFFFVSAVALLSLPLLGAVYVYKVRAVQGDFAWNGVSPLVETLPGCDVSAGKKQACGLPFTAFRPCLKEFTLPGKDGIPLTADDVLIDRGSMSVLTDKQTKAVVAVQLHFKDVDDIQYNTEILPAFAVPAAPCAEFVGQIITVHVHAQDVEVSLQGGKRVVGTISAGDIEYQFAGVF